jgi:hypothetical protein
MTSFIYRLYHFLDAIGVNMISCTYLQILRMFLYAYNHLLELVMTGICWLYFWNVCVIFLKSVCWNISGKYLKSS